MGLATMLVVLCALIGSTIGVESDIEIVPTSSEWKLIPTANEEYIDFPIQNYILEIKGTKPENVDRDPVYEDGKFTPKEHTKIVRLRTPYDVDRNGRGDDDLGFIAWNPIHYVKGFDVFIEFCHQNAKSYREEPCDGASEQIWAWNFQQDRVSLSCNGILEYEIIYDYGEFTTNEFGDCSLFGTKKITQIDFRHLEGWYYRGIEKNIPFVTSVAPFATSTPRVPDDPRMCDCWNARCGWCTSLDCAVKYEFADAPDGITIISRLWWRRTNNIVLYNPSGVKVGEISFSRRAVFLEGCVKCGVMRRVPFTKGELSEWTVSLFEGVLKISVEGVEVVNTKLIGECKEAYAEISYIAFSRSTCEGQFLSTPDMEFGKHLRDGTCDGQCEPLDL